jgi:hypothetical protein
MKELDLSVSERPADRIGTANPFIWIVDVL